MNLTQRQLGFFVAAAEASNLSRAAQRCHLSQPAFSRALQALERQLGAMLIHRGTRHFALTPEGERLLPLAQRLLDELSEAVEAVRGSRAGLGGRIAVAVGTAFGGIVLPAALLDFARRHPAVRVRVIDDNSRGITSRVLDGEAQFGIGSIVGHAAGLAAEPLLGAPLGLIANPSMHRLPARSTLVQALELPLVKESEDTSIMTLLRESGSPWSASMERGVEVSSLALQLALVRAGVGVSIVSALGASHPAAVGLRFVPLRPRIQRQVLLMHRSDRPMKPAALELIASIRRSLDRQRMHPLVVRTRRR